MNAKTIQNIGLMRQIVFIYGKNATKFFQSLYAFIFISIIILIAFLCGQWYVYGKNYIILNMRPFMMQVFLPGYFMPMIVALVATFKKYANINKHGF